MEQGRYESTARADWESMYMQLVWAEPAAESILVCQEEAWMTV